MHSAAFVGVTKLVRRFPEAITVVSPANKMDLTSDKLLTMSYIKKE